MSGCFGGSSYDRWLENQVMEYCDQEDLIVICKCCDAELYEVMKEDILDGWYCPECFTEISILDYDFVCDMNYVKANEEQQQKIIEKFDADYEKANKRKGI